MTLYDDLPFSVEHNGRKYKMRPYYDRMLKVFALYKDDNLTGADKAMAAMRVLGMSRFAPVEALAEAFKVLVGPEPEKKSKDPIFDFEQDAGHIYASFLQAYGIDLRKERGRLHWLSFIDLFNGLPEDTQMARIMAIRARPVPKPNGKNQDQIMAVTKLKQQFAIKKTAEQAEHDTQSALWRMYEQLMQLARE